MRRDSDPDRDIPEYSYQARKRQSVDPAMRRIVLAAGGISVVIIGIALVWSGVRPRMGFGPPSEIAAPDVPLRVAPADPGGLTVPGANEPIMSGNVSAGPATLAPEAPQPYIQPFQPAAPTVAAPTTPAPPPPSPPPASIAATPPAAATGPAQVQLAATADSAGAHQVWAHLVAKYPPLLKGKTPVFIPAIVNGNNVWRLRVGGFADQQAARAFCADLTTKGAACTVVGF
ncbi:MAG: SPOR domain-containing protein [Acidocella sp.]|nr:SPOR domain-containing protein [Acidocella sp.]